MCTDLQNESKCKKEKNLQSIQTSLTLAGYCTISTSSEDPSSFSATKPNFEVGSSSKLSFAKPSVWSLANDLMDEEVDLIDQDQLLEESDLLKQIFSIIDNLLQETLKVQQCHIDK